MNADNTTPRPWLAHGCVIESASRCVTVTRGGIARADWQDDCPDARLIVRAVNSFDAMREALRWALDQIEDDLDLDHQAALSAARAALALADTDRR